MEKIPAFISILFLFTVALVYIWILLIIRRSSLDTARRRLPVIAMGLLVWLAVQAVLSLNSVYNANIQALPPKLFVLGILPALLVIILLFITRGGRSFIDSLPLSAITALNIIRIPVEIVLFYLFVYKAVPQLMTFEGRNFDVLSGITAPFIAYGFAKGKLGRKTLLAWNIICLGLLLNIVINALLSAPFPLQQFAFDQPNIAILYFPFVWLPVFIVPVVLLGHLISIRRLAKQE